MWRVLNLLEAAHSFAIRSSFQLVWNSLPASVWLFFFFFFVCHQENVVDSLLYSSVNRILLEHKNLGTIKPFSFGFLTLQELRDWKMSQNLTAGNKDTMLKTKKILPASSTGSTV